MHRAVREHGLQRGDAHQGNWIAHGAGNPARGGDLDGGAGRMGGTDDWSRGGSSGRDCWESFVKGDAVWSERGRSGLDWLGPSGIAGRLFCSRNSAGEAGDAHRANGGAAPRVAYCSLLSDRFAGTNGNATLSVQWTN